MVKGGALRENRGNRTEKWECRDVERKGSEEKKRKRKKEKVKGKYGE